MAPSPSTGPTWRGSGWREIGPWTSSAGWPGRTSRARSWIRARAGTWRQPKAQPAPACRGGPRRARMGTVITVRRDREIFETDGGWFHARWHFSFDRYRDPDWTQFG